ncbi:N-acetylmuramoyl-L-alanine amidase [Thiomicrospira microaerophila]|uniref:N-acetylmuramoyl-L-alanine amidase n=1 Tax=Thiomicrospira microaerophila TaxID=406020 RepID=UPI0005CA9FFE|nr:N-acetylmuramoyl-L-alanine amidase [Thiomicrospira microaerophila]
MSPVFSFVHYFRILSVALLLLVGQYALASNAELSSIRLGQTPDQTRIVFEIKNNDRFEVQRLSNPERLVVDFYNARNTVSFRNQFFQDPRLAGIRLSTDQHRTRVVLDLRAAYQYRYFTLAKNGHRPERLVIDLTQPMLAQAQPGQAPVQGARTAQAAESAPKSQRSVVVTARAEPVAPAAPAPASSPAPVRELVQAKASAPASVMPTKSVKNKTTESMLDANRDFIADKSFIIAIDPGHGGRDVGAIGPTGVYEKDVVLALSKRLKQEIDAQPNMRAILTRDTDVYLNLQERIAIARRHNADIFISVHADAYSSSSPRGGSIYVLSNRGASSVMARKLAQRENAALGVVQLAGRDVDVATVLTDLTREANLRASRKLGSTVLAQMESNNLTLHKTTVQSAEFAVLRSIDMPSMLVEAAFISNPYEEKRLQDPVFHQTFAQSVTQGLATFIERTGHAPRWGETLYVNVDVRRGDTLSDIAQSYGVSMRELMRLNNMTNPNQLHVGRQLRVPVTEKMMVQYEKIYKVKPGDTLSAIALENKVSVKALMEANNLRNPNQLYVGRELKIPVKQSLLTVAAR